MAVQFIICGQKLQTFSGHYIWNARTETTTRKKNQQDDPRVVLPLAVAGSEGPTQIFHKTKL
jgi:hypothetical protein